MAIPLKDPDLVSFGTNFSTRITASPSTWNLLAADATQYSTLLAGYVAAYTAMSTGRDAGNRSQSLTSAKNATKASFLAFARACTSGYRRTTPSAMPTRTCLALWCVRCRRRSAGRPWRRRWTSSKSPAGS